MKGDADEIGGGEEREFDRYQRTHPTPYYPEFEHVAGAPGTTIGDKLYIDSGPEARRNDATDHLFHK